MWFTDSDKVLWTLVVCAFINIFGFAFMDENFWRFIIALVAAVFAIVIKHHYDNWKDRKRLDNMKSTIIDLVDNIHLITIEKIKLDYIKLIQVLSKPSPRVFPFNKTLITPIKRPISEAFEIADLIKIISRLDSFKYSQLYNIEMYLENIVNSSPAIIHDSLAEEMNNFNEKKNPELLYLNSLSDDKKNSGLLLIKAQQDEMINKAIVNCQYRLNDIQEVIRTYDEFVQELKN